MYIRHTIVIWGGTTQAFAPVLNLAQFEGGLQIRLHHKISLYVTNLPIIYVQTSISYNTY